MGIGAPATSFVGPAARWVGGVAMRVAYFPRMLKHLIAFGGVVGEGCLRLQLLGARLQALAPLQHRFLRQADSAGQLRARLPLQHPAQEQQHMHGGKLALCEDGAAVEVIHALALVTTPDRQATTTIDAKEAGIGARCVAMRALLPSGMEVVLQPCNALLIIKEVYDRKVHVVDLTKFALFVQLSQSFLP